MMERWPWLLFEIAVNFYQGVLVTYFIDHTLKKKRGIGWTSALCCIAFALCCTTYLFFDMPVTDTWIFLIPLFYALLCFEDSFGIKLLWWALLMALFNGISILSTLGLLLIGLLLRQFAGALILVLVFYSCQSSGGGYHASTHLRCFLTMCAGLLVGLAFPFLPFPDGVFYAIGALSVLLLLAFPLVLHPNKSYLKSDRKRLILRSVLTTLFISCLACALLLLHWAPASIVSAAFLLSAISRLCAKLLYPRV